MISHSRPQSPRSFWPVAGIESSGFVQHRKSALHGLPVKSGKFDWLRIRNEDSAHTQKIGSGQSSRSLPQARRIVGSGDENGTSVVGPGQRSRFLVLTKRSATYGDENRENRENPVKCSACAIARKIEIECFCGNLPISNDPVVRISRNLAKKMVQKPREWFITKNLSFDRGSF